MKSTGDGLLKTQRREWLEPGSMRKRKRKLAWAGEVNEIRIIGVT